MKDLIGGKNVGMKDLIGQPPPSAARQTSFVELRPLEAGGGKHL